MLKGIHHVAIICSDYVRSKAFYHQVLQLPIIGEHYRAERQSYKLDLQLPDGGQLELFSFPNPPARPSRPEAQGLRHLAFRVDSVEQTVAYLADHNIIASRTSEATANIETIITEFQQGSSASLQSVDQVNQAAHQRAADIETLSQAMAEAVNAMQAILQHANQIKQQAHSTADLSEQVQSQIMVIANHAQDTSTSAGHSRDISLKLADLSEQLAQLLGQFSLSNKQ